MPSIKLNTVPTWTFSGGVIGGAIGYAIDIFGEKTVYSHWIGTLIGAVAGSWYGARISADTTVGDIDYSSLFSAASDVARSSMVDPNDDANGYAFGVADAKRAIANGDISPQATLRDVDSVYIRYGDSTLTKMKASSSFKNGYQRGMLTELSKTIPAAAVAKLTVQQR